MSNNKHLPLADSTPYREGTVRAFLARDDDGNEVVQLEFGNKFHTEVIVLTEAAADELRDALTEATFVDEGWKL